MLQIRRESAGGGRTITCFTGSKLPVAMNARLYASMVASRRVRPRHAARELGAGCCAAQTNGDCTLEREGFKETTL